MPDAPKRIQRKRTKGWRMPDGAVYVGRPTRWGNPWRIGVHLCAGHGRDYVQIPVTTRSEAVKFFADTLSIMPRNYPSNEEVRAELRGRDLVCWCALDQPCHADVLLEMAND